MCGRVGQASEAERYASALGWTGYTVLDPPRRLIYNVPPGTTPLVMHTLGDGDTMQGMHWGYKPHWYERQPVINARLDTILKGSAMWRPTLKRRVIVPVDGWFEWTGEPGEKQPWFIYAKDDEPIFLAGVCGWKPGEDAGVPENGFAIVTDDAAGGMVDIHDRRPVALNPDDARQWLDGTLDVDAALELLSTARPESAFAWHAVTTKINSSRYQKADATRPI